MKLVLYIIFLFLILSCESETDHNPNVVLITIDGVRWQEIFTGADSKFISNLEFAKDTTKLKSLYWDKDFKIRRQKLMPFLWSVMEKNGQIYGNRSFHNHVNLTNGMWFSYPGYNEILSGFADDERIQSNDKVNNPNTTILELINKDTRYKNRVAAFGSWDVFPFIINQDRSGIPVNAGFQSAQDTNLSEKEMFLNKLQNEIHGPWGNVRLDPFTHHFMMEYVKKKSPDMLYIAYGEPDDWAHDEDYRNYLLSITLIDQYISELWTTLQSTPKYKNNTLLIITTDHGRGVEDKNWSGHGSKVSGADQTWLAIMGPGITAKGEIKTEVQLYTNQIARYILNQFKINYVDPKMGDALQIN